MAKIIPIDIIKGMTGKVCQHSDTYFSMNTSSGNIYTGKRCNPYTGEATEKQKTQQTKFKTLAGYANTWLKANHPTTALPNGSASYQKVESMKKSMQLSNVRQVLFKYMDEEGSINLPEDE